jgi:hypothetical protein
MAGEKVVISVLPATLAYGLALTLFISRCAPVLRARTERRMLALVAVCAFLHLPIAGVSLLALLRGALGDLSLASLVLLAALFFRGHPRQGIAAPAHVRVFAFAGLVFFSFGFGLFPLDPYESGYASAVLPCLAGGLALIFWYRGRRVLSLALLAALAGWRLHWLDSTNLWDYLLDVPLVAAALGHAVLGKQDHCIPRGHRICPESNPFGERTLPSVKSKGCVTARSAEEAIEPRSGKAEDFTPPRDLD